MGYFVFDTHIAKSQKELIGAINTLKDAQVSDLVIDMRYNGGGLLYTANGPASMIASPASTTGKTFQALNYNDKSNSKNQVLTFYDQDSHGQPLLHLNLHPRDAAGDARHGIGQRVGHQQLAWRGRYGEFDRCHHTGQAPRLCPSEQL